MMGMLKSFKKDWIRWSPAERRTAIVVLLAASMGLLGQVADTIL